MCLEVRCPNGQTASTVGELKAATGIDMVHVEAFPDLPPVKLTDGDCLCLVDWKATLDPVGLSIAYDSGSDLWEIVKNEGAANE